MNELQSLLAIATKVVTKMEVDPGMNVLDFGCSGGIYSLALAKSVAPQGLVFAIDKEKDALSRLRDRIRTLKIANILPIKSEGSCDLDIASDSIDFMLLFDVLHDHYFTFDQRSNLFEETSRVLTSTGILAVFPNHIENSEIDAEITYPLETIGFVMARKFTTELVHDESPSQGDIMIFKRNNAV